MIINGENLLLGRVASIVAKKSLEGEDIVIVNCEKMLVSGSKEYNLADAKLVLELGEPRWGPFPQRRPAMFVKRVIRGMVPYRTLRGKEAMKRINCLNKMPKEYEGKEFAVLPKTDVSKLKINKYVSVGRMCQAMGGRV